MMKTNRRIIQGISIGILILLSTALPLYLVFRSQEDRIPSNPIIIWNNDDFINYGFSGEGSKENPYLIENLEIITEYIYGINIKNTDKYFVIRNCYVDASEIGIYLDNIANETAIIIENICTDNEIGIKVSDSDEISITKNECLENDYYAGAGIVVLNSNRCNLTQNYCYSNEFFGIKLENTESCYVYNNTCIANEGYFQGAGIYVYVSDNTILEHNVCRGNMLDGIHIHLSENTFVVDNLCEENYVRGLYMRLSYHTVIANNTILSNLNWGGQISHGMEIEYSSFFNLTGNTIDSNRGNGITLRQTSDSHIHSNIIANQIEYPNSLITPYMIYLGEKGYLGYGIFVYSSSNLEVTENTWTYNYGGCWLEDVYNANITLNHCQNNREQSIRILNSDECSLNNNTISSNKVGVIVNDTLTTTIAFNKIHGSNSYGLSFLGSSSDNLVYQNSFKNNNLGGSSQGYDEGTNNIWYNNVTKKGNYWLDRVSGNYSIDGPSNSEDIYCLDEDPLLYLESNLPITTQEKVFDFQLLTILFRDKAYCISFFVFQLTRTIVRKGKN